MRTLEQTDSAAVGRRLDSVRCELAYCRTAVMMIGEEFPEEKEFVEELYRRLTEVSAALADRCIVLGSHSGEGEGLRRLLEDLS